MKDNTVWVLQQSNAYFSMSTEDEYVDNIVIMSLDEKVVDLYISENNIQLGRNYLYDNNYVFYTKKCQVLS